MTDGKLDVRRVATDAEMDAFLRFPWTCYKDEPNWVPPLWSEHKAWFDREENPELGHVDIDYFVAWRDETPVGTVAAFVNHAFNDFQEMNIGWFGAFEVLEDREAAQAMLAAVETWCREKGVEAIWGPATFSTNSEIGMLIDGFDTPPKIMMTHDHPYYKGFVESAGYEKEADLYAFKFDGNDWGGTKADKGPEKVERVVGKLRKRRKYVIRNVNMRNFDDEVERLKAIYNNAWEKNWGFVPLSDEEIDKLAGDLKQIVDPDMSFIAEIDGETVGFGVPLPDIYGPLRHAYPRPDEPELFALVRLLWHWKIRRHPKGVRVWALGVRQDHRGTGLDAIMIYEMMKAGLPKGYLDIEMSWILESNEPMIRIARTLGAEVYKTYRVFRKAL